MLFSLVEAEVIWALAQCFDFARIVDRVWLIHNARLAASSTEVGLAGQRAAFSTG